MCVLARLSFGNQVLKTCFQALEENHQKVNNVGVERSVATRRAQMVWPMMTVTVTNLTNCAKLCENAQIPSCAN